MTFPEGLDPTVIHEGLWHFVIIKGFSLISHTACHFMIKSIVIAF